jgi:nicotinate-nucleotide--dimethylbenzimidazole phosphoribosyltransferase
VLSSLNTAPPEVFLKKRIVRPRAGVYAVSAFRRFINKEAAVRDFLPDRELQRECAAVVPVNPELEKKAQAYLDSLSKPPGSLGRLEELARRLYAVQERMPLAARPARLFTIAADHGVVEEGVAANPAEVTALMLRNFLGGGAAINSLCASAGVELCVVNAGIREPCVFAHELFINAGIASGTANMAKGPAMNAEQCVKALRLGVTLAERARSDGVRVLGTGEMGIGNTTASSALFCAYFGFGAEEMTGMGAGAPAGGLAHKARVIARALEANAGAVASADPFAILAALGGLEIAALAGLILGGAARRMAVMIDGFIATAAYTAAWKMAPAVRGYCFFSHGSAERGHTQVLRRLEERPLFDLDLRLGEGTGAALGLFLLEAAAQTYNNMATLHTAGIG